MGREKEVRKGLAPELRIWIRGRLKKKKNPVRTFEFGSPDPEQIAYIEMDIEHEIV